MTAPVTSADQPRAKRRAMRLTPSRLFLGSLGTILIGYAFLGRGFAYVGVAPIYVGEIVLALGLLAVLLGASMLRVIRTAPAWFVLLFMALGVTRTIPYVHEYGVDAFRDGVLWGYGLFALIVPACLLRSGLTTRVPGAYSKILPWFLVWAPIGLYFYNSYWMIIPTMPGTDVPFINPKAGDVAVHLGGIAAFLLLGLHHEPGALPRRTVTGEWGMWLCWFAGALFSTYSRGAMVAMAVSIAICQLVRPVAGRLLQISLLGALIGVLLLVFNANLDIGAARGISADQITRSVTSIFSSKEETGLSGSKEWRLQWWNTIIGYTIDGPYFWTGKGFGINLARSDGFEVEWANRNPHDAHLNILARMGVPGLALWILVQASFLLRMTLSYINAVRAHQAWWAKINLWIVCYWSAFLINASFDVFLEGPQGGIWFWSVLGFGIAVTEAQKLHTRSQPLDAGMSSHDRR